MACLCGCSRPLARRRRRRRRTLRCPSRGRSAASRVTARPLLARVGGAGAGHCRGGIWPGTEQCFGYDPRSGRLKRNQRRREPGPGGTIRASRTRQPHFGASCCAKCRREASHAQHVQGRWQGEGSHQRPEAQEWRAHVVGTAPEGAEDGAINRQLLSSVGVKAQGADVWHRVWHGCVSHVCCLWAWLGGDATPNST